MAAVTYSTWLYVPIRSPTSLRAGQRAVAPCSRAEAARPLTTCRRDAQPHFDQTKSARSCLAHPASAMNAPAAGSTQDANSPGPPASASTAAAASASTAAGGSAATASCRRRCTLRRWLGWLGAGASCVCAARADGEGARAREQHDGDMGTQREKSGHTRMCRGGTLGHLNEEERAGRVKEKEHHHTSRGQVKALYPRHPVRRCPAVIPICSESLLQQPGSPQVPYSAAPLGAACPVPLSLETRLQTRADKLQEHICQRHKPARALRSHGDGLRACRGLQQRAPPGTRSAEPHCTAAGAPAGQGNQVSGAAATSPLAAAAVRPAAF